MYLMPFILVLILFAASETFAQQTRDPPDDPQKESLAQDLIRGNIVVSEWLDSVAEAIDLFLTGRKLTKVPNETRVRIENSSISTEGKGVNNTTSLNIQLRLPNVEEYFQLKFTSYDEQEERSLRRRAFRQTPRRQNYGASVGFFRNIGKVKTVFQPRIQLKDPLYIQHLLRLETLIEMQKSDLNPKIEFFADPDRGTGIFNQLNVNFYLMPKLMLTLVTESEYDDKQLPHFRATNGFSFTQTLNPKKFLTYHLLFDSQNEPNYHLDNYDVGIGWNHTIYKQILDYQLLPHLNFARARRYKGEAGVTFNVNLNF